MEEYAFSLRTPTLSWESSPTHYQSTIMEFSHHLVLMTHNHIRFISSFVGTLVHTAYSTYFGVETTKPTIMVAPPPTVQTHEISTFSTLLGSRTSTYESFSYSSTNTTRFQPYPHNLAQNTSPLDNIFHSEEDIPEAMMKPECLWDFMDHCYLFLPEKTCVPIDTPSHDISH